MGLQAVPRADDGRAVAAAGRYFRMYMIRYFEGIDTGRGIAWRCADSFSLRDFLRLSNRDKVPDHSWLSRALASAARSA
ncbi:MAG: transposase [Roseiarcus sp.]